MCAHTQKKTFSFLSINISDFELSGHSNPSEILRQQPNIYFVLSSPSVKKQTIPQPLTEVFRFTLKLSGDSGHSDGNGDSETLVKVFFCGLGCVALEKTLGFPRE